MNKTQLKAKLKEYMSVTRLSGYEGDMARLFAQDMGKYADGVVTDRIGNVIAQFEGTDPSAPSLMVFAHMDVIGFIVTCIDDKGFLRVERMGGVPEKIVQSTAVNVGSETGGIYPGIIGTKAYHVMSAADKEKADPLSALWVDIGADSREQVQALGIEVGCPVTYANHYCELLGNRVTGTYIDDASGLTSLLHIASMIAKTPHNATVYLVGTVWEEFNARGAMMAQRTAKADMAICLMGPGAGDTPDQHNYNNVRLGGGPGVTLFNFHGKGTLNGCIAHKGMFELMKSAAQAAGINLQRSAARGALSDTAYIQLEDMGIPCLDMGTPDRYSHSQTELCDLGDLEQTGLLVTEFIRQLSADFNLNRF